jgi:glycosyltransferase involved in cell wall biosynthesis
MVPHLSIVTTCKGRLEHLRQSLPRYLAQPDAEVIVVDFDCPEDTAGAVAREFPAARVVPVKDEPNFDIARARNLGGEAARGEWIAFFDADVLVVPDFHERLRPQLAPGTFHRFFPRGRGTSLFGSCLIRRADWLGLGRYDEAMEGYGGEDQEMYFRLGLAGLTPVAMAFELVERVILHDNAARIKYCRMPTMLQNTRINSAYLVVKMTLLRLLGVNGLSLEQCRTIYRLVGEVVTDANRTPDQPIHFTIDIPTDPLSPSIPAWKATRQVTFNFAPTETFTPEELAMTKAPA